MPVPLPEDSDLEDFITPPREKGPYLEDPRPEVDGLQLLKTILEKQSQMEKKKKQKIYKMFVSDPKDDSRGKSRINEYEFDIDNFLADV